MENIKDLKKDMGIQSKLYENVSYRLLDENGNVRLLFKMNALGNSILRFIRKYVAEPITAEGKLKDGFLNYLSAYGLRIPLITGLWVGELNIANLVTNAGFAGIASRINGAGSEAAFVYIAMGTGATAASTSDVALQTELAVSGLSRVSATATRVTTTVTNDTAQLVYTFAVTGSAAITESGVLNAASVGTLLCRQVFSAINVVDTDNLQITWKIKAA